MSRPNALDEHHGVPKGWLLFKNVPVTTALPHDPADGIINILRPVHDVEIELRGGIRVQNLKWLHGHPPEIRLRGDRVTLEVVIDQQTATCDEDGRLHRPRVGRTGEPQNILRRRNSVLRAGQPADCVGGFPGFHLRENGCAAES